jgi:hypothetical protein
MGCILRARYWGDRPFFGAHPRFFSKYLTRAKFFLSDARKEISFFGETRVALLMIRDLDKPLTPLTTEGLCAHLFLIKKERPPFEQLRECAFCFLLLRVPSL